MQLDPISGSGVDLTVLEGRLPVTAGEIAAGPLWLENRGPRGRRRGPGRERFGRGVGRRRGAGAGPRRGRGGRHRRRRRSPRRLESTGDQRPHRGEAWGRPGPRDRRTATGSSARVHHAPLDRAHPDRGSQRRPDTRADRCVGGVPRPDRVAAMAHALFATVRDRSQDLYVLRSLGFTPRQAGLTIGWMSITNTVVGLAVGIPLGVVAGSLVSRAVADAVGIATDVAIPWFGLALVASGGLVLSVIVAAVPSWRASPRQATSDRLTGAAPPVASADGRIPNLAPPRQHRHRQGQDLGRVRGDGPGVGAGLDRRASCSSSRARSGRWASASWPTTSASSGTRSATASRGSRPTSTRPTPRAATRGTSPPEKIAQRRLRPGDPRRGHLHREVRLGAGRRGRRACSATDRRAPTWS